MLANTLSTYIPDVGDIVEVDSTSQSGLELTGDKKKSLALVLSKKIFNSVFGFAVLCPIEDKSLNSKYEIELSSSENSINVFILYNQVRSLDWKTRNATFKYKLSDEIVYIVKNKIGILL